MHIYIYILESSGRPSGGLDSSGWHSDQGSQNQGIAWEIRLWKNDMEHYSTSFCREFRCASSWHSHLIRSAIFWFFYQGTLKSLRNHKIHKIQVPKFQGRVFWGKKSACGRHIDHGGWERARHSHILQVYRHPTSIQTPYKYTDTQQLYRHTTGIQYPEYKSRHLKIKSRHPKTSPNTNKMRSNSL